MSYEIRLAPKAVADLNSMPLWLQALVEPHLEDLANNPLSLSRPPPSPPYAPGGMLSENTFGPLDGRSYHITVFFRYAQDEAGLIVGRIVPFEF